MRMRAETSTNRECNAGTWEGEKNAPVRWNASKIKLIAKMDMRIETVRNRKLAVWTSVVAQEQSNKVDLRLRSRICASISVSRRQINDNKNKPLTFQRSHSPVSLELMAFCLEPRSLCCPPTLFSLIEIVNN
jgi:hypothetical protein